MRLTTLFAASIGALLSTAGVHASYVLDTEYNPDNFFQEFDFFTDPDPTEGFVQYVDGPTAMSKGMAGSASGAVYLGVDYNTQGPTNGRQSTRVQSRKTFTKGLFVADLAHMPASTCGLWPAFWMFGPNWPMGGEIDIIEGVHNSESNSVTLHTGPGCQVSNQGAIKTTTFVGSNCNGNDGCGQATEDNQNYGDGFNANGGGIYAMDWTDDHMAVWYFPRHRIPKDILNGTPEPDVKTWGQPSARFSSGGSCNLNDHFSENQIVFNIDFCGSWAGSVWSQNSECSALAPTCNEYVANNPGAFWNAFWMINSVKVYKQSGDGGASQPTGSPTLPTGSPQPTIVIPSGPPAQSSAAVPPPAQSSSALPPPPVSQPQPQNPNTQSGGQQVTQGEDGSLTVGGPQGAPPPPPPPPPQSNGQSVSEGEDGSLRVGVGL